MSLSVHIKKKAGDFRLSVDFEHDHGITGILGPSGCGKSMTFKCIAGIEKPDEGRIVLNNRVLFDSEKKINLKPQERNVGYLFQNYALFPNMTVEQNIRCGLYKEKDREASKRKLRDILEIMELTVCRGLFPHQLSGGQQQRTALARILVNEPELLLLDEPFSALDSYLKEQLQPQVRSIMESFGKDVLMVSHNRAEIDYLCGQTVMMKDGEILNQAKKREACEPPSMDLWIREAKSRKDGDKIGMYLTHNGIVRRSARAKVRCGKEDAKDVAGMLFSYDPVRVDEAVKETYGLDGIYYVKVWLNEGTLQVGDDLMYVLVGGDIRPHVIDALQYLVDKLKNECVKEKEIYEADENRRGDRTGFMP